MTEELKVPDELIEVMIAQLANTNCRDSAINLVFRTKTALKYAKEAERLRCKFWKEIHILYPETNCGRWNYDYLTNVVTKKVDSDHDSYI